MPEIESRRIVRDRGRWLAVATLLVLLLPARIAVSQDRGGGAPPPPTAAPSDPLGRDTPRGTLRGFMRTAREGKFEAAVHYLNTPLTGARALDLAQQLYVVLDSRLPVRLVEVSDHPEGSRANPLKPDEDVVGTISAANGQLELAVERVTIDGPTPVWVFSRRTLNAIPDVYSEINLISLDRYLPNWFGRPRIFGVRPFELVALLLVPLYYRLLGLAKIPGYFRLLVIAFAIHWLLASLDLPLRGRLLWSTVAALLTMVAGVWILLWANARGERYMRQRFRNSTIAEVGSLVRVARRLVDVLIVVAGMLVALKYFGADPTAALAGLGIGGVAVALAAQKTLENVIGGLSLIFDRAVRVGDFLKLGDIRGTVDSIGLRSTRVRTLDRTIVTVPNGQVANASIETISARDMCWFRHVLGIRYGTTAAQLRHVLEGVRARLLASPLIEPDTIRIRLFRFGPSSLDVEIFAYVLTEDWPRFLEVQERLLVEIMEVVEESGTAIAFPTQTLHITDQQRSHPMLAALAQRDPEPAVSASPRPVR